jgi:thiol-disulfide isomerase/thioredoxin
VFTLVQWLTLDTIIRQRFAPPQSWKALLGSIVVALAVFFAAARLLWNTKRNVIAGLLLLPATFCVAVASSNALQFLPRFLEQGTDLGALKHYAAEDLVDTAAPSFSLKQLRGEPYVLEAHRGKVIVIDFWATWCGPCIMQLPHFQKLHDEFRNAPVEFLAVSVDRDTARVQPFVDSLQYSFTTLYAARPVEEAYRVLLIPTTFIIDKKGIIRKIHVGYYGEPSSEMRHLMRNLIEE